MLPGGGCHTGAVTPPKAAHDTSGLEHAGEDCFLFWDAKGEKAHGASEPFLLLCCCYGNAVISANRDGVSGGQGNVLIGAMRGCGRIALRNREAETEK